jgi:type I restriction enzyme R subunit
MREYKFVEAPFLAQLQDLGWQVIDQGPASIPSDPQRSLRSSFKEVVLKETLVGQLININTDEEGNSWLTHKQAEDLADELLTGPYGSLLEANKLLFHKLVDDYPRVDKNELTGEENPVLKLIDFDHPERNTFHAINQFRIDIPGGVKPFIIPDIVLFVNGLPLVLVECKDGNEFTSNPMYEGFRQLQRYSNQRTSEYKEGEERLFYFNQFNIITTGEEAKLGTITSSEEHYYFWKDIYPEQYKEYTPPLGKERAQEKLIQGVLPPDTLLDLVRHCILYMQVGKGKEVKIIARYQQQRAIGKICERLLNGENPDERSGVMWHTQGSGKSLTMVMLVRKLRSHPELKDYKVLMVNDRTDLEKQLGNTATLANEPIDKVANSRELREKLSTESSNIVMVMVHKFQERETLDDSIVGKSLLQAAEPVPRYGTFGVVNKSEKVLILIDEAHRTQSSDLGDNLFEAFPNATRIAFTGTPLITERHSGHRTYERFGSYIDKYRLQDAVEDGATIQILYEGKAGDSAIRNKSEFDTRFEDLIKDHSEEEKAAIKRKYGTYADVVESEEMIRQKAQDMVEHYLEHIFPNGFKAQVVASSVIAATRYKVALESALASQVKELEIAGAKKEVIEEIAHLQVHAVVTSKGTNEDADVTIIRKAALEANAIENFKKAFNPADDDSYIAMLVVCDMLLTGFDAPIEQVMYIDKKMKEHNLLQAIARVNRTYNNKNRGFVVDYIGIANHLKEALQIYGGDAQDILDSLKSIDSEIPILESRYRRLLQLFEDHGIVAIEAFVKQQIKDHVKEYEVLEACVELGRDVKFRANFDVFIKNFFESMDIILPNKAAYPYRIPAKRFAYIHAKMKQRYKDETLSFGSTGEKIKKLVNEYLMGLGIDNRIPPVELLSKDFDKEVKKNASKKAVASEMEHAIKKHIKVSWEDDPALYKKLSEKLEEILKKYRDNYEQQVLEFEGLSSEILEGRKGNNDGLSEIGSLLLDNLVEFSNNPEDSKKELLMFIPTLISLLKSHISREHFWEKSTLKKELEAEIETAIIIEGIDKYYDETGGLISDLMQLVKRRAMDITGND